MADTVEQLWKDQTLQEKLYPITKESAVVDDNNVSLNTKIASISDNYTELNGEVTDLNSALNSLELGIDEDDGLLYLYVNGVKQGEGVDVSGGGITQAVKVALLNCFSHVAWIDDQGQTYYDALEDALYPPANLVSISAVYTQSGTVYDNQTLDSLKSDLVVTAHYDNSTTQTVTDYVLSGTLAEGTSTITVSYGGKTTTFDVTVTRGVDYTLDAFDDATWEVGKDYNRTTGAYVDATNQVATDKFTVQDCLYNLTGSGATYPGLFAWDEQGNYQGRFESSSFADFPVLGLPSKFTYAFHVYDSNGTFVSSNAHYMPINNSANQTAQISIRLSDHLEEFTWQSGYGQIDITNILAEYGINASNLNSKINRTSEIAFIGGGSSLDFTNSNGIVIYNISPYQGSVYLIPRTTTATNLTNLKAFISENDPVFIINGEV